MTSEPIAAAVQMVSGGERETNLAAAGELIRRAADAGARLVVLPENFAYLGHHESDKLAVAETDGDGPAQAFLAETAARQGIWLVGGTVPIAAPDGRAFAACLVFDERGERVARYDKIHLFDVGVPDSDESYCESDSTAPGDTTVVVDSPVGRLGLSVCYDLRFPALYRRLVDDGAEVLLAPSAFTQTTGRAHWEVLLRARAVENLCHVIAPDQGGRHPGGRTTWGDSMIVGPWGDILDRVASGPGLAVAAIDRDKTATTRDRFPCLAHRRL